MDPFEYLRFLIINTSLCFFNKEKLIKHLLSTQISVGVFLLELLLLPLIYINFHNSKLMCKFLFHKLVISYVTRYYFSEQVKMVSILSCIFSE